MLLATVDAQGVFTYVHVGYAGSVGDAASYIDSMLKAKIDAGLWLPESASRTIRGISVRPFIVGDAAFQFSSTLWSPQ